MTLAKRRLLYFIFIGAFCIITPLVILYANGYQLSFSKKALVKTGMLIVDTYPQNAEIKLDLQSQTSLINRLLSLNDRIATPAKVKNLIPGEYAVQFSLPGYWTWKKMLQIKPGESTYAEDVTLFRQVQPRLLSAGEKTALAASPDAKLFLATGHKTAEVFDGEMQTVVASSSASSSAKAIWSSDGKLALAGETLIRPGQDTQDINIEKILGKNISNAKWSGSNGSILFYHIGNQVFQYDINEQKSVTLFSESAIPQTLKGLPLLDFVHIGDKLYLSFYRQAKSIVVQYDLGSGAAIRETAIPSSKEVAFINYDQGHVNLLDRASGNLHLLNFDNYYPLEDTISNITNGYWASEDRLLGWNESEIFIYEKNIKQKNLLTRVARPVRQVLWHSSNNYVIYATDNEITSFELDDRDRHNTIVLAEGENIKSIALDKKSTMLYIIGKIQGQPGLFSLEL
ncbi:hypothetical protein HGA34_00765 [Candidatus Falkowbacteria bacterium]|nr:hypothetical protein [Candidatus Falkowbacteria bacterium]